MQPDLSTGRLYLRPPTLADVPDVVAACQDEGIARWTTLPVPYGEADARAWVDSASERELPWAVLDATTGRLLAAVGLSVSAHDPGQAEVGYWAAPWGRGRGVVTEAVRAVTRYAFGGRDLARVQLRHAVPQVASCRVAVRCGYLPEGVLRGAWGKRGERHDLEVHSRLATDPEPADPAPADPEPADPAPTALRQA